jgi:hypothetical protein
MPNKTWKPIRDDIPLNDSRVATYADLMEAEDRIAAARMHRGATNETIEQALDHAESPDPERESDRELYLGTLRRYVEALGGELREVPRPAAVFPEETIELPGAPRG